MNKLSSHPAITYPADAQSEALPRQSTLNKGRELARCLLVLVPPDTDYTTATRRIWELANAHCAIVRFLGLCQDPVQELGLRRQLAAMAALVGNGKVFTEAKVEVGTNWLDFVKRNYEAGDMIVCFAEPHPGLFHRPLSQVLESDLGAPVYILSTLAPRRASRTSWLFQVTGWAGSFGILAAFFWLQVKLSQLPQGGAQTVLLILSALVEIWLIWIWNGLFS